MIYDEVRIAYLSARERPKEYEDEWGNLIDKLRQKWDGTGKLGDLMRDRMDENLLFSEKAKDAGGGKAKRIYQLIKDMRNDADITQDPFRKKYGDKLVNELIKSKELFAMFLHWAYRDHKKALPIEHWEMHGKEIDNFTSGYQGLDLTDDEVFDWLVSNYGEDEAIERLETKLDSARQHLYQVFSESLSNKAWGELVESKRLAKSELLKGKRKRWMDKVDKYMQEVGDWKNMRQVYEWLITQTKLAPASRTVAAYLSYNKNYEKEAITQPHTTEGMYSNKVNRYRWNNIQKSDFNKEDKDPVFIQPNKPMYRIFEIDDMKELRGFTGEWVVQEKYDGMRVQLHKDSSIKVYSFNGNDITDKFEKQIQLLNDDKFPNCILDAEAVLYMNDEPLHRADTLAYVNSKEEKKDYDLKVHVFDILKYEEESIVATKLEERLQKLMNTFSAHSHEFLQFPNKRDTRFADSLEEIEDYAKEIMENPTSEGVIIKDAKSSYVIGKKKNPKWIKWKKFVDLDLIVLDKRKNKNGTFSYTLGAGPLSDEDKERFTDTQDIGNKTYLKVGKALNTKITVNNVGKIIRVKVDEVKKTKKGYTLYSAKVIEIPEVTEAEKIITLEFLSKDNKKSASDYNIEALKKSYVITDNIHGIAKLNTELHSEGFVLTGIDGTLMAKNALLDIDLWKDELKTLYGKDSGLFYSEVSKILNRKPATLKEIIDELPDDMDEVLGRLIPNKKGEELEEEINNRLQEVSQNGLYGIEYNKDTKEFSHDGETLIKVPDAQDDIELKADYSKGDYKIWRREDEDLNLVIDLDDRKLIWRIQQNNVDDIFSLFGKADKFEAQVDKVADRYKLLDEGGIKLGSQRDGYHEYFLSGDLHNGKMHFRVIPVDGEERWLAWTGYEQTPTDKESDKGVWDIDVDRYKSIKYTE